MKETIIDIDNYLLKNSVYFDDLIIEKLCKDLKSIFNDISVSLIKDIIDYKINNKSFNDGINDIETFAENTDNYIFSIRHNKQFKNPIKDLNKNISDENYPKWLGVLIGCIKNSAGYQSKRNLDLLEYIDYEFKSYDSYINYLKYCCILSY